MSPAEDASLLLAIVRRHHRRPPRSHELAELALLAELELPAQLLALQTYAVEARYEEGPFPLPAARQVLLAQIEQLLNRCAEAVDQLA